MILHYDDFIEELRNTDIWEDDILQKLHDDLMDSNIDKNVIDYISVSAKVQKAVQQFVDPHSVDLEKGWSVSDV